ncbi:MAG: NUDIX domain-containing protein [Planctomycetia bacterium]
MTPRPIAVAVVVHAGRVLVGRRADDAAEQPGRAEFPGGTVEPHETSAAAALRECVEEAGIAIRVLDRTVEVVAASAQPPVAITFHWATPLDPDALPRPPFAWVPIAELPRLNFPAANAQVIAMLGGENATVGHGGS